VRRTDPRLRLGALFVALAAAFAVVALSGSLSPGRVRGWVDGFGLLGPVAFVVVAVGLSLVFFPGPILAGASGLLFGTALGTPVAIVSAVTAACAAFSISRWVAGDAVERVGGERVRALAAWVEDRGFLAVLYLRLAPGVPYMAVNYGAGLTRLRIGVFGLATLLGTAPRTFAYVALGGSFGDLGRPEAVVSLAILAAMAVGGLFLARRDARRRRAGIRAPPYTT